MHLGKITLAGLLGSLGQLGLGVGQVWADNVPSPPGGGGAGHPPGLFGGGIMGFLPLALIIVAMYFLMIRPANKQRRDHQTMLNALKKDDEVVFGGGIYGRIVSIDEKIVHLEIADKVKIKALRERITGKWLEPTVKSDSRG